MTGLTDVRDRTLTMLRALGVEPDPKQMRTVEKYVRWVDGQISTAHIDGRVMDREVARGHELTVTHNPYIGGADYTVTCHEPPGAGCRLVCADDDCEQTDAGMLDVAGFDTAVPNLISGFSRRCHTTDAYGVAMNQSEWPAAWTHAIGREVARVRRDTGTSAAALSARCAELGCAIPRNTIANLESGRKESLPIHELVAIARALNVTPLSLLFPEGEDATVAYLPGVELPSNHGRIEFVGPRAPHVDLLIEGLKDIRRGVRRIEAVDREARESDPLTSDAAKRETKW